MKLHFIFSFFVLFVSTGFAQSTDSLYSANKIKLNEITGRVNAGDYNALNEVATMPTSIAVPYLQFWTEVMRTSQQQEAAIAAIKNVQGYADYLKQDMANVFLKGSVPVGDFITLGSIGTPDAAAVVAPYLFDGRLLDLNKDNRPYDICGFAMGALEQMKLTDAPQETLTTPNSVILIEWQKWALSKGLVPKEWSSRVGAPAWMVREEAMDKSFSHEIEHVSAVPAIPESSKMPQSNKAAAPMAKENRRGVIWLIAILATVIFLGIYFIRKRP